MSKYKTSASYKITKEAKGKNPELGNLYLKNVPVVFAKVHTPSAGYNTEDKEYSITVFFDEATRDQLDEIGLNKEMSQVGVTKIKKGANRGKLKYDPESEHYAPFDKMFGFTVSRPTVKRNEENEIVKEYEPPVVIDAEGEEFTQDVGNGSVCNVKLFTYRNADGMLVLMLDTVVVLEHVAYEKAGDAFDEELGVTIKRKPKQPQQPVDESEDEDEPEVPAKKKVAQKPSKAAVAADSDDDESDEFF